MINTKYPRRGYLPRQPHSHNLCWEQAHKAHLCTHTSFSRKGWNLEIRLITLRPQLTLPNINNIHSRDIIDNPALENWIRKKTKTRMRQHTNSHLLISSLVKFFFFLPTFPNRDKGSAKDNIHFRRYETIPYMYSNDKLSAVNSIYNI